MWFDVGVHGKSPFFPPKFWYISEQCKTNEYHERPMTSIMTDTPSSFLNYNTFYLQDYILNLYNQLQFVITSNMDLFMTLVLKRAQPNSNQCISRNPSIYLMGLPSWGCIWWMISPRASSSIRGDMLWFRTQDWNIWIDLDGCYLRYDPNRKEEFEELKEWSLERKGGSVLLWFRNTSLCIFLVGFLSRNQTLISY